MINPEKGYTGSEINLRCGWGEGVSARAWSFVDGRAWLELRAAGLSMTVVGSAEDVRTLAAELVKAADSSEKATASVPS